MPDEGNGLSHVFNDGLRFLPQIPQSSEIDPDGVDGVGKADAVCLRLLGRSGADDRLLVRHIATPLAGLRRTRPETADPGEAERQEDGERSDTDS